MCFTFLLGSLKTLGHQLESVGTAVTELDTKISKMKCDKQSMRSEATGK